MSSLGLALVLLTGCTLSACQKPSPKEQPSPKSAESSETTPGRATPEPEKAAPPSSEKEQTTPEPTLPQPRKRYVVAALGDSITDARSGGGGYLKVLRTRCPKSTFLNFGKGGDMTNQMRRRWESEIRPQISSEGVNTLLVYGGVNDLYSDLTANRKNDRIEADLTAIYQGAREAGLEVVAVTVSPWGEFSKYWNPRRGTNTKLLNSWIMGQVAAGLIDKAVDSYALLSCGDPNVLCRDYETRSHDGLHPGSKGHAILGQKLAEEAFSDCL